MRSIKQRRTKPRTDSNGNIKRSTFNGTSKTKQYVNKNTYLDSCCCEKTSYQVNYKNSTLTIGDEDTIWFTNNNSNSYGMIISPDGKNIYIAGTTNGGQNNSITYWDINDIDGTFSNKRMLTDNTNLLGAYNMALDPSGRDMYIVAKDQASISFATRNTTTGDLQTPYILLTDPAHLNGVRNVILSPDGKFVYVVASDSNSISYWTRNTATGMLSNLVSIVNNVDLGGVYDLAMPSYLYSGYHIYVAVSTTNSIRWYARDQSTGALTLAGSVTDPINLNFPVSVKISPNGKHVYAVGKNSHSIVYWDRNILISSGALTNQIEIIDPINLNNPQDVAVSPDGNKVYAVFSGSKTIVHWNRYPPTGILSNQKVTIATNNLDDVVNVAVSPNSKYIYTSTDSTSYSKVVSKWNNEYEIVQKKECNKFAHYRNPILGHRIHLESCSQILASSIISIDKSSIVEYQGIPYPQRSDGYFLNYGSKGGINSEYMGYNADYSDTNISSKKFGECRIKSINLSRYNMLTTDKNVSANIGLRESDPIENLSNFKSLTLVIKKNGYTLSFPWSQKTGQYNFGGIWYGYWNFNGENSKIFNNIMDSIKYGADNIQTFEFYATITCPDVLENDPKDVYIDNYAKSCMTNPDVCYNPRIKRIQNKNGCIDESYNYSTNQYLTRRCATAEQQDFFLSNNLVKNEKNMFKKCNNCSFVNDVCTSCKIPKAHCVTIYKRSNRKFNQQGGVSGGSRINRLKYQTRMKAQTRRVNGKNQRPVIITSVISEDYSFTIYWKDGDIPCGAKVDSYTIEIFPSDVATTAVEAKESSAIVEANQKSYTYHFPEDLASLKQYFKRGTYDVRVRTESFYGHGPWTCKRNISLKTGPSAPTSADLSWNDRGRITLKWGNPERNGGSEITNWRIKYSNMHMHTTCTLPAHYPISNGTISVSATDTTTDGSDFSYLINDGNINNNNNIHIKSGIIWFDITGKNSSGYGLTGSTKHKAINFTPDNPTRIGKHIKNNGCKSSNYQLLWHPPLHKGLSDISGYILKWHKYDSTDISSAIIPVTSTFEQSIQLDKIENNPFEDIHNKKGETYYFTLTTWNKKNYKSGPSKKISVTFPNNPSYQNITLNQFTQGARRNISFVDISNSWSFDFGEKIGQTLQDFSGTIVDISMNGNKQTPNQSDVMNQNFLTEVKIGTPIQISLTFESKCHYKSVWWSPIYIPYAKPLGVTDFSGNYNKNTEKVTLDWSNSYRDIITNGGRDIKYYEISGNYIHQTTTTEKKLTIKEPPLGKNCYQIRVVNNNLKTDWSESEWSDKIVVDVKKVAGDIKDFTGKRVNYSGGVKYEFEWTKLIYTGHDISYNLEYSTDPNFKNVSSSFNVNNFLNDGQTKITLDKITLDNVTTDFTDIQHFFRLKYGNALDYDLSSNITGPAYWATVDKINVNIDSNKSPATFNLSWPDANKPHAIDVSYNVGLILVGGESNTQIDVGTIDASSIEIGSNDVPAELRNKNALVSVKAQTHFTIGNNTDPSLNTNIRYPLEPSEPKNVECYFGNNIYTHQAFIKVTWTDSDWTGLFNNIGKQIIEGVEFGYMVKLTNTTTTNTTTNTTTYFHNHSPHTTLEHTFEVDISHNKNSGIYNVSIVAQVLLNENIFQSELVTCGKELKIGIGNNDIDDLFNGHAYLKVYEQFKYYVYTSTTHSFFNSNPKNIIFGTDLYYLIIGPGGNGGTGKRVKFLVGSSVPLGGGGGGAGEVKYGTFAQGSSITKSNIIIGDSSTKLSGWTNDTASPGEDGKDASGTSTSIVNTRGGIKGISVVFDSSGGIGSGGGGDGGHLFVSDYSTAQIFSAAGGGGAGGAGEAGVKGDIMDAGNGGDGLPCNNCTYGDLLEGFADVISYFAFDGIHGFGKGGKGGFGQQAKESSDMVVAGDPEPHHYYGQGGQGGFTNSTTESQAGKSGNFGAFIIRVPIKCYSS